VFWLLFLFPSVCAMRSSFPALRVRSSDAVAKRRGACGAWLLLLAKRRGLVFTFLLPSLCCRYSLNATLNEDNIKESANWLIHTGMRDAGYKFIMLDDGWEAEERDSSGRLQPDATRFPSGFRALSDWLHARGLLFGIYTTPGNYTCLKKPVKRVAVLLPECLC
jgi:hypothetical protein